MFQRRPDRLRLFLCLGTIVYLAMLYLLSWAAIGVGHGTALFLNLTLAETVLAGLTLLAIWLARGLWPVMLVRVLVLAAIVIISRDEYPYVGKVLEGSPLVVVAWIAIFSAAQLIAIAVYRRLT